MSKSQYLQNYRLRDRDFINEQIAVDLSQAACFGPNAKFIGCQISISSKSSQLNFCESLFQDCLVHFTRKISKLNFRDAQFINSRFRGILDDCDFGARDGSAANEMKNRVLHCDFSEADLRGCRFFNTDIKTLKFPAWPTFTIIDYHAASADLSRAMFPGAPDYAGKILRLWLPGEKAVCLYAKDEAMRIGCTVAELKDFFLGKPYVIA